MSDRPHHGDLELRVPALPVPTYLEVGDITSPEGKRYLVLFIHTPSGVTIVHLTPDVAEKFGIGLARRARRPGGLIVPAPSQDEVDQVFRDIIGGPDGKAPA